MEKQGIAHEGKLLHWDKVVPNEKERSELDLLDGEEVYQLEILRLMNNEPLAVSTTWLVADEFPGIARYFSKFHSLYQILLEHYHLYPLRSRSVFQAVFPSLKDATLLEIKENIPVIRTESIMNHPNGRPIEYTVSRTRGDRQKYIVEF